MQYSILSKQSSNHIFLLNDQFNASVLLWILNCGALISDTVNPKHRAFQSINQHQIFFHLFSIARVCFTQASQSQGFYKSTCLIIGFHLLPYFLLWDSHCFSIKKHLISLSDLFTWLMGLQCPLLSLCRAWQSSAVLWRESLSRREAESNYSISGRFSC